MTVRQQRPTLEEFLQWPDQKPHLEFVHGEVRPKAMPDFPHGALQVEFSSRLWTWSKSNGGHTMTEQRCILQAGDETHTVLPDVSWWSYQQLPTPEEGPQRVPPTLVVEILSPNDRYGDVQDKVIVYLDAGVALVWVVDPLVRKVTVYRPGCPPLLIASPLSLEAVELPGLCMPLNEVFSVCDSKPRLQE